jgi:glutathione S-transferase
MPEIEPEDRSLKDLTGLHLWHAPMSSCSQRVRIALAEADQVFESHLIDLKRGEHASAAYQAIHPKGVVPALVDNGHLIIESIDIIMHVANDASALAEGVSLAILAKADAAQPDLKLLTFEFLFSVGPKRSREEVRAFQENHRTGWLKQFYRDFAAGFDRDRIRDAVARTKVDFDYLDALLSDGRPYLSGVAFTLADIAWMPNFHRFDLMGWPFEKTPHLQRWFLNVSARPSYRKALVDWEDQSASVAFSTYTSTRRAEESDVRSFYDLCAHP